MGYCTASDVRLLIKTDLSDADIDKIIEINSAVIDKKIGVQSASDQVIKKLCMLLSAIDIRRRDPESFALGEYRVVTNVGQVWQREADRIFNLYRKHVSVSVDE